MSDPTPGPTGPDDPDLAGPIQTPLGDETVRVPLEPEVAWDAPEPPRALPWEAPAAAPPLTPGGPGETAPAGSGWTSPPPAGVLSATAVGWVAPPPAPVATDRPGWVIASTGVRFGAWLVDVILAAVIVALIGLALVSLWPDLVDGGVMVQAAYTVGSTGLYFLYFVGFWTSASKATPGMRLFKLQVANAADGRRLAIGPAVVRWLALGYIFSLVGLFEPLAAATGMVALLWYIALLVTTASDPMHQGLHDRWAKSVIVRPDGAGSAVGCWVAGCLIVVLLVVVIPFISMVALYLTDGQFREILSTIGGSI